METMSPRQYYLKAFDIVESRAGDTSINDDPTRGLTYAEVLSDIEHAAYHFQYGANSLRGLIRSLKRLIAKEESHGYNN